MVWEGGDGRGAAAAVVVVVVMVMMMVMKPLWEDCDAVMFMRVLLVW